MNNTTLCILQLFMANGLGPSSLNKMFERAKAADIPIEDIPGMAPDDLEFTFSLKKGIAEAIFEAGEKAAALYSQLDENRVSILSPPLANYPEKLSAILKNAAPPLLFVKGDLDLLYEPSVGFGGSRNASPIGLEITRNIARELAKQNICVTSGYAKGVDLAAHRSAMEAGGATIFVLAEGILRFTRKREIADVLDEAPYLILSQFSPGLPWNTSNAMQRNRTVVALSDAMLLIESGTDGGTFSAGEAAIELQRPLFTIKYKNPPESAAGNAVFIDRGATPLAPDEDQSTDLAALFEAIEKSGATPTGPKENSSLDFEF